MQISQKCQYGLRAVFELAKHPGAGPVKVSEIAEAQAIPLRFLEVILNQLKRGGFVESWRGAAGGYTLGRSPADLSLGEVIRFIEGPMRPVTCLTGHTEEKCRLYGSCVFLEIWEEAQKAMSEVFDRVTFKELIEREARKGVTVSTYNI